MSTDPSKDYSVNSPHVTVIWLSFSKKLTLLSMIMKTGRIRTLWIIISLSTYTGIVCTRSILKYFFSTPTRPWVDKVIHQWVAYLLKGARVQYKVINPLNVQPPPGKATILMCNHTSAYDIPLGFVVFPNHSIRMLAKKELSKIPIFGKGMQAAEFPFVDRKNRMQAVRDLEYARQLMESGIILWIAPEGTRSKDGKVGPFKKGSFITAIEAKATIIPIGIRGAFDILPPHTLQVNLNQTAEIHIGEPIDASQYTADSRDELINKTREEIRRLVGEM